MSSKPMKGSLKAKQIKRKEKKVVRNILTLRDDDYWPIVPDNEVSKIENILKEHLSVINSSIPKVPWYILMKMTKEQRKIKIQEKIHTLSAEEKDKLLISKRSRSYLAIGVNNSIRLMEQKKLLFCLIDSNGEPKLLLEKLLALSKQKQALTALVPNLKTILKPILGFHTFVLGFKKTILEESCSINQCSKVKDILDKLNLKPSKINLDSKLKEKPVETLIKQERLPNIYLYRSYPNKRVFHPDSTDAKDKVNFISVNYGVSRKSDVTKNTFKRYTDDNACDGKKSSKIFDSPLVLTLQNNPTKRKKK